MFRWRLPPQSWIRSALVRRFFTLVLLFAAFVIAGGVHANEVPGPELAFDELVRQGDLARFAGRNSDAVRAYMRALKIRNDPRIEGRLGLVALAGGAPAQAAPHLLRAIVDGHTIAPGERQQIKDAFDRARPLVSRIGIKISHIGAEVTIDGKLESMATTAADFYVFRMPGHHEFRATLEGFEDAVVAIDTKKGDTVDVSLVLVPLNETPAELGPVITCEPKAEPVPCKASSPSPPKSAPPARTSQNSKVDEFKPGQWVPGIGVTIVYGAVSPYPSPGGILSSSWKITPFISAGFDFRFAMSPRGIEGYAIRGATFALLPSACASREWFQGCLLGHFGGMWHSSNAPKVSSARPALGVGVSLGARFLRIKPFELRVAMNAELLEDEYPIRTGEIRKKVLWTGPQFLTGLSIIAAWDGTK